MKKEEEEKELEKIYVKIMKLKGRPSAFWNM